MPDPFSAGLLMVLESALERVLVSLFDVVHRGAQDKKRRRELTRPGPLVERISGELAVLDDRHEWAAAVDAVRDSVEAALPLREDEALEVMLDTESLKAHILSSSRDIRRAAALSDDAGAVYDALLTRVCVAIVDLVWSQPEYARRLQVELFRITQRTSEALARLPELRQRDVERAHREFEDRYAAQVAHALGGVELFGVSRGRAPRRHSFDTSYVSLAVARCGEENDELTGAGLPVMTALADTPRVVIRGGAGAGKSTFLRWLAMNALGETARKEWLGLVPFFVPLRQFVEGELPKPEQLIAGVAGLIEEEKPARWVTARLLEGRALLLIDGVDELVSERREQAKDWLVRLTTAYPNVRYAVTTRPAAVPEDWLEDAGFVAFDLLPLSDKGVRDFLECWHAAARSEPGLTADAFDWLTECERRLNATLAGRPELRRLASSPLLCGLLCALHQDRNMHLPRDRRSLYEAALDLLLVRWDEERGVVLDAEHAFSKEEQLVLLQRFAYSLVRNRELMLPREDAVLRMGNAMRGLRPHGIEPTKALQRLLERTGLLREASPDHVRFVHRTFRDYLAAKEVVDAGDLNLLVDRAHLDEWHDVVVMAVAHARPRERARILQDLLAGNDDTRKDERMRDRLRLLALACLDQADVIEPEAAREHVKQVAARLIPPRDFAHAEALAEAGEFVIDLLPGPGAVDVAPYVVRTLANIGGEGAWERIAEFARVDHTMVIDELLRAWRNTPDAEQYARAVLSKVDFGDRRVDVRGWHRVQFIGNLALLRVVRCVGNINPLDPLAAMPRLRRLELWQNEVLRDLTPLRGCGTLKELHLNRCRPLRIVDLSPLADIRLDELSLHFSRVSLDSLAGARIKRLLVRHESLDDGLDPLPPLPELEELVLDHRPPHRSLAGISRWPTLRRVSVFGTPDAGDVAALRELPSLTTLVVQQAESRDRVEALRKHLLGVEIITT